MHDLMCQRKKEGRFRETTLFILHVIFCSRGYHFQSPAGEPQQGLFDSTCRKSLKRRDASPFAAGYASNSNPPYSADEVPPKVCFVPGMLAPPSCQVHPASELRVV